MQAPCQVPSEGLGYARRAFGSDLRSVTFSSVLVVAAAGSAARALACLGEAGVAASAIEDGANLVPDALQAAPDALLWWAEGDAPTALPDRLAALQSARPVPVALACAAIAETTLAEALAAGLHACAFVTPGAVPDLSALLVLARTRFAHEQGLKAALAEAEQRLAERKLVDRAKGILMRGRAMSEDQAFGVLRTASMQAKQRVGQVSERVIEAAAVAEAVNRAGQLRMLSQRIVKLAALRLAGIDPADTRERLDASVARVEQQITALGQALAGTSAQGAHERVEAAWQALHAALAARPRTEQLAAFDTLAEALLDQADALTRQIEGQGGPTTLHVVNLCGRQRMLVQRLAKQALLASLLRGPAAGVALAAAGQTIEEFQRALSALQALPIRSPEIRDGLDEAERAWQQMREALREANGAAGRRGIAHASEILLALFDRLTAHYEHSLQVILG